MKKTLVEVKNLDEHICTKNNTIYLDGSIILTPSAKDELNKRRIAIVNGSRTESDTGQCSIDCVCEVCIKLAETGSTEKNLLLYSRYIETRFWRDRCKTATRNELSHSKNY